MIRDTPQTMPRLNQLVIRCRQAPEANSSSPSLELMLRAHTRSRFPARISAQTIAIGVRDRVLPPIPTTAPSGTSAAASSSDMTFSLRIQIAFSGADQRPDHRHRRARQGAATDPDYRAIGHQRRRFFERHDLFFEAPVALAGAAAKLVIGQVHARPSR